MLISTELLARMAGVKVNDNMRSVAGALADYGSDFGLDRPHRLAHFLAQLMHESGKFRFDREVWGPTPAQKRYDTRTDLGNTPAADGDGKKNAGRGPIQVTGGYNIAAYEEWCKAQAFNPPDFTANPDLINTDPWEGLSAIWYWSTRKLNRLADENNIEQITKKINGGLNGFADRMAMYDRCALVLLGYGPTDIEAFQTKAHQAGTYIGEIDGESGPKTRAAMHLELVKKDGTRSTAAATVKMAPVTEVIVEEKEVAVVAKGSDKRKGLWSWGSGALGAGLLSQLGRFFDMPWQLQIGFGAVGIACVIGLLFLGELVVRRVKSIVKEIET